MAAIQERTPTIYPYMDQALQKSPKNYGRFAVDLAHTGLVEWCSSQYRDPFLRLQEGWGKTQTDFGLSSHKSSI
eukprot:4188663-Amphidinium_carterae.1